VPDVHERNIEFNRAGFWIRYRFSLRHGYPGTVSFNGLSLGFLKDPISDSGVSGQSYEAEDCYAQRYAFVALAIFLASVVAMFWGGFRAWYRGALMSAAAFCIGFALCVWSASVLITRAAQAENGYTYYCKDGDYGNG
jgi:hypothetical protein